VLDGATNQTVDSVWDAFGLDIYVGDVTSDNSLFVVSGGGITNANSFIGAQASASNNTASVSGPGAHWVNTGTFQVGAVSNSGNSVSVSSGGTIVASNLVIHADNTFNLNADGTLEIAGAFDYSAQTNLNWNAGGTLAVGGVLTGLAVTNGASVLEGEKNLVLKGGSFSASSNLIVGFESSDNFLAITAGAGLASTDGFIGWGETAGSNAVLVSDTGSAWTNTGNLYVGTYFNASNELVNAAAGNSLSVSNGAWVYVGGVDTNLIAKGSGGLSVSDDAELVVGDGASILSENVFVGSATSTGAVSVWQGGTVETELLDIDAAGTFSLEGRLVVNGPFNADSTGFNWKNGGALTVRSNLTYSSDLGGSNKVLTIDGGSWNRGADLLVDGFNTTLSISNGGRVESADSFIGAAGASSGNRGMVSGNGSAWVSDNMNVGFAGSGNSLQILAGGLVESASGLVGVLSFSSNNTVMVSGTGSRWINTGNLVIGTSASNTANSVTVEDGGIIEAADLFVGADDEFNLNADGTLAVKGAFDVSEFAGFNWNANGHLSVGNLLEGMIVDTNQVIGAAVFLNGGRDLTITDATGNWLNGDNHLIVGLNSDDSTLTITNGGTVENANGYIGWGAGTDNNAVVVGGAGSMWRNAAGGLYVGQWGASSNLSNAGNSNSLTVQADGWVVVGEADTNGLISSGGLLVASTNGAELVVGGGRNSQVDVAQTLYVGTDTNTTGKVEVLDNGTVAAGDLFIAENSSFDLYGTLNIGGAFDFAAQTNLDWKTGGTLSVGGALSGLNVLNGTNRTLRIAGGTWDTTGTNLYIIGTENTMEIIGGGQVYSVSAFIGNSTNDLGNIILVSGSNSTWALTGDLTVGANNSSNSTLKVENNGLVNIGGSLAINAGNTLSLASNGTVEVAGSLLFDNAAVSGSGSVLFGPGANQFLVAGADSTISSNVLFDGGGGVDELKFTDSELTVSGALSNQFVNFETLTMTNSLLVGSGTIDVFDDIDLNSGRIVPSGMLLLDGTVNVTGTVLEVDAYNDMLHVTGTLDISSMGAEITVPNGLIPVGYTNTILLADGGVAGSFDKSISGITEHYLLYDFIFSYGTSNAEVVSIAKIDGEIGSTPTYAGMKGVRAGFNGMQNAVFVRTKQLRRNLVATAHAIPQEAFLLSSTNGPAGARGPGDNNTIFGMHFWAEHFNGQGDYDAQGLSSGFTLNNNGTTMGLDRLFGESTVLGVNYTYARSTATADTSADRVETETYWLGLYGEWVGERGFYVDALAGLGWTDYDATRTDINYRGVGSFEGEDFGGHLEVGNYFHHRNWALAPYIGLHYLNVRSDDYTETEQQGGTPIRVDGTKLDSLESALGLKLRNRIDTRIGRIQTVGYVEWMHDLVNEEVETTLSDETISVKTARIAPDANLLNAGIGLGWMQSDNMEFGIGYDGRFNRDYEEHTGSLMLSIMF
jgi:T5SS/PEP-CTERM-associated repeat protein